MNVIIRTTLLNATLLINIYMNYFNEQRDADKIGLSYDEFVNQKFTFEKLFKLEIAMWTKPAATEMRFGFEVTMYVMNK